MYKCTAITVSRTKLSLLMKKIRTTAGKIHCDRPNCAFGYDFEPSLSAGSVCMRPRGAPELPDAFEPSVVPSGSVASETRSETKLDTPLMMPPLVALVVLVTAGDEAKGVVIAVVVPVVRFVVPVLLDSPIMSSVLQAANTSADRQTHRTSARIFFIGHFS